MENLPNEATQNSANSRKEIWQGLGMLALLHVLFVLLCLAATIVGLGDAYAGIAYAAFIGFTQFVYVIPALLITWRMRRIGWLKGILIGAAITFLVTSTCALAFKYGNL